MPRRTFLALSVLTATSLAIAQPPPGGRGGGKGAPKAGQTVEKIASSSPTYM